MQTATTEKPTRELTAREVYDRLVETSRAGRFPAIDETTAVCTYRAPDGRRCAVGLFLPDDAYTPDLEGSSIEDIRAKHPSVYACLPRALSISDWRACQTAHDELARDWNHNAFVQQLTAVPAFAGFTPAPEVR